MTELLELETKMVALATAQKKKKKKSISGDWTANIGGQDSVFHHKSANIGGWDNRSVIKPPASVAKTVSPMIKHSGPVIKTTALVIEPPTSAAQPIEPLT